MIGLSAAAVLIAVLFYGARLGPAALANSREITGWVLAGVSVFLLLFNVRKRIPAFPVGRGYYWLQLHIYLGLFSGAAFLAHSEWRLPTGVLDWCLWLVFAGVFVTGVFGIVLSRLVPSRLNARGERVIYERIPAFRTQLAGEVEALVLRAVQEAASSTIAELYVNRLLPFLSHSRNFWAHMLSASDHRQALQNEIHAVRRYLPAEGNAILDEIEARVLAKDDLDYQYTWQSLVKGWLLLHLPLSCAMIPLVVVHVVINYAFGLGGM